MKPKVYTSSYAWATGVLYRCFDAGGRLLYVGATSDIKTRSRQHRNNSPWWSDVDRIATETFDYRWQAMAAERAAIVAEQPLHNRQRYFVDIEATA